VCFAGLTCLSVEYQTADVSFHQMCHCVCSFAVTQLMATTVTLQFAMAIDFAFQSVAERQLLDFTQQDVELSCLQEGCSIAFKADMWCTWLIYLYRLRKCLTSYHLANCRTGLKWNSRCNSCQHGSRQSNCNSHCQCCRHCEQQ